AELLRLGSRGKAAEFSGRRSIGEVWKVTNATGAQGKAGAKPCVIEAADSGTVGTLASNSDLCQPDSGWKAKRVTSKIRGSKRWAKIMQMAPTSPPTLRMPRTKPTIESG